MRESQTSGRSTILVIIILLISMQFAVFTLNVDEESSSDDWDGFREEYNDDQEVSNSEEENEKLFEELMKF